MKGSDPADEGAAEGVGCFGSGFPPARMVGAMVGGPAHWPHLPLNKQWMAEREGFEPPCRLPGKTLSRRPRYDHFGTSPLLLRCALAVAGLQASSVLPSDSRRPRKN